MTVLVIGNATVDISFDLYRLPEAGETIIARSRMIDAGGKGLNQAIVANRTGAGVVYVAAVGSDSEADFISSSLSAEGLSTDKLFVRPGPTDQSIIYLDASGENMIVSTAEMAKSLRPDEVLDNIDRLGNRDVLLMQGNLTLTTTEACLQRARSRSARTVLNPAPIAFDYEGLWPLVDIAILNEVEARVLSGASDPYSAAKRLMSWGVGAAVMTLGARGAFLAEQHGSRHVAAPAVEPVDTAGAGDVFCGMLAAALSNGSGLPTAVYLAVSAASLSVTRRGTSSSFPTRAELDCIKASARTEGT